MFNVLDTRCVDLAGLLVKNLADVDSGTVGSWKVVFNTPVERNMCLAR